MRRSLYNETIRTARQQGRDEVRSALEQVLLALLRQRFGSIPDSLKEKIKVSPLELLIFGTTHVFTAQSPDEVLAEFER